MEAPDGLDHQDADEAWKPKTNPWVIALTVTLATFMEVLDSSIANVSLPHIGGALGATRFHSTRSQADCSPANIARNIAVRNRLLEAYELA